MDAEQLAELIRQRKPAILARWEQEVRSHAVARALPGPVLLDSMPEFIDQLANTVALGEPADPARAETSAVEHAHQRLGLGYELGQLLAEYGALRIAITDELQAASPSVSLRAWSRLTHAMEAEISEAIQRFSRARERKLHALERMSSDALGAPDLDATIRRLIDMLAEVVPEVDEVTILLRDGNSLRATATHGLEAEVQRGFSIAIGEGFAGTIAASREPLLLRDAATHPLVRSDAIRALGVQALYGVPLIDASDVIGVAHMGSTRARDFQPEDLILFRAIASQATAVIASRRALDRERETHALRDVFIGVLGHDLRSPLQAVVGSAHLLLRQGHLDERGRRVVDRITRSADRMDRLIRDLLDFARARIGGGIPLSRAWLDLADVARSVCEEAELAHPGRVVQLRPAIRSRVCGDADRISQLVSNLLWNALKYGAQDKPVVVSVDEDASDAVIVVKNEGPRIPPDLLPHVFEPFRQGSDSGQRSAGLGLFITKTIAVAHGGSIEAVSDDVRGTAFTVRIPKRDPSSAIVTA